MEVLVCAAAPDAATIAAAVIAARALLTKIDLEIRTEIFSLEFGSPGSTRNGRIGERFRPRPAPPAVARSGIGGGVFDWPNPTLSPTSRSAPMKPRATARPWSSSNDRPDPLHAAGDLDLEQGQRRPVRQHQPADRGADP